MKKYIKSSSRDVNEIISAIDLGDEFYDKYDSLVAYLNSLPAGTELKDIVNSPGSHWAGQEVVCKKKEGYDTVYYNRFGVSPSDAKYKDTWWEISGSKTDVYTLAKIITKGTKYYCTRDVFEDDDFC